MKLKVVFSDFDGTLTIDGRLGLRFLQLLDLVEELGVDFVVISGGGLSLGYFLLTYFPINCCAMEGGGVIVRKGRNEILTEEVLVSEGDLAQLEKLEGELQKKFPGVLSVDSFGRKTDRAVDFKFVDEKSRADIECFLADRGAAFSSSNIHINFWYGEVSKYKAIERILRSDFPGVALDHCLYFGDALNDQSVFKRMKHTVGVSNIAPYLERMEHHPEVVLRGEENRAVNGVYRFLHSLK